MVYKKESCNDARHCQTVECDQRLKLCLEMYMLRILLKEISK